MQKGNFLITLCCCSLVGTYILETVTNLLSRQLRDAPNPLGVLYGHFAPSFLYLLTVYYHYRSRVRYVRNFHNRLFSAVLKGSTSFKTAVLCVLCGFYEFFIF